ncbi:DUF4132 domain-containing protein [Mucilaginibacter gynuensis]|uniref:DUF4132 domain-containing protein n=1 Tax=Mucilaginibacter gynuensis TaxID=1302236 RepID=UPI0031EEA0DD
MPNNSGNDSAFGELLKEASDQIGQTSWWNVNVTELAVFNDKIVRLTNKEKAAFIIYLVEHIAHYHNSHSSFSSTNVKYIRISMGKSILSALFKMKLELDDDDLAEIIHIAIRYNTKSAYPVKIPLKAFLNQIQKKYTDTPLPKTISSALKSLQNKVKNDADFCTELDKSKLTEQIGTILNPTTPGDALKAVLFPGDDELTIFINQNVARLPNEDKAHWYAIISLCKKASGAKPSNKYLDEGRPLINKLGADQFKVVASTWFDHFLTIKEKERRHTFTFSNQTYTDVTYTFLSAPATECFKGVIWLCATVKDTTLLQRVALVAERAYRKLPGHGQMSTAIGNASLFTLYKAEGLEGIGHLSRLKVRIKLNSTLQLIEKYMVQAATDRAIPVSVVEDLAVDDLGLINNTRIFEIDDCKAIIQVEKVDKVSLTWQKKDGGIQKSEPAFIKEKYPAQLKEIKLAAKQIEVNLSTQRDRIDLSFKQGKNMLWEHFDKYYLQHGLISIISHKLIWQLTHADGVTAAYWLNGEWIGYQQNVLAINNITEVCLWHPATATVDDVQQWRAFFIDKQIQQPIKQAFREVYLLTDAEINTRNYSNRMAGHILKQHQFNSLAKVRGWQYMLQGQFDNGADGTATIKLPENNLIAQYWTNVIGEEAGTSGIFNYVSTDQVRFVNMRSNETVALADIPVIVFSEVMRDVDLFVGVTSVGNDPNWRDNGGLPAYNDYWTSYSFGDLTEVAKNRKETLTRLLPRLKIAPVASITDKFLVIKGKKRTYKIHLGSTNILMEPNDQYLCIVADRSQKNLTENIFLPFEGDGGLSMIISKALLLADDDKIKDVTITRQINHR